MYLNFNQKFLNCKQVTNYPDLNEHSGPFNIAFQFEIL